MSLSSSQVVSSNHMEEDYPQTASKYPSDSRSDHALSQKTPDHVSEDSPSTSTQIVTPAKDNLKLTTNGHGYPTEAVVPAPPTLIPCESAPHGNVGRVSEATASALGTMADLMRRYPLLNGLQQIISSSSTPLNHPAPTSSSASFPPSRSHPASTSTSLLFSPMASSTSSAVSFPPLTPSSSSSLSSPSSSYSLSSPSSTSVASMVERLVHVHDMNVARQHRINVANMHLHSLQLQTTHVHHSKLLALAGGIEDLKGLIRAGKEALAKLGTDMAEQRDQLGEVKQTLIETNDTVANHASEIKNMVDVVAEQKGRVEEQKRELKMVAERVQAQLRDQQQLLSKQGDILREQDIVLSRMTRTRFRSDMAIDACLVGLSLWVTDRRMVYRAAYYVATLVINSIAPTQGWSHLQARFRAAILTLVLRIAIFLMILHRLRVFAEDIGMHTRTGNAPAYASALLETLGGWLGVNEAMKNAKASVVGVMKSVPVIGQWVEDDTQNHSVKQGVSSSSSSSSPLRSSSTPTTTPSPVSSDNKSTSSSSSNSSAPNQASTSSSTATASDGPLSFIKRMFISSPPSTPSTTTSNIYNNTTTTTTTTTTTPSRSPVGMTDKNTNNTNKPQSMPP